MSQLHYMTKLGAGVMISGTASELGARMLRLRTRAVLRSDAGAKIGERYECDGACDGQCGGWHYWYEETGDGVLPDADGVATPTD